MYRNYAVLNNSVFMKGCRIHLIILKLNSKATFVI